MSEDPILAAIAELGAELRGEIVTSRTEIFDRIEEILDRLERRLLPDVPLHQRGFWVMEEPPA